MQTSLQILYIDRGAAETPSIRERLAEAGIGISVEIARDLTDALGRLRRGPNPIQMLMFSSSTSDPFERQLLDRADRLGIGLPPVLVLEDEAAGVPEGPAAKGVFPDRFPKREGYLVELPYRIRSAIVLGELHSRLLQQKAVEENLRVHQIELEMQNEELKRAQLELDASRARYFDLYDLAPVGYCTIGQSGLILEANLTFASQLGLTRSALLNRPFSRFIHREDSGLFYCLIKDTVRHGHLRKLELRMLQADGTPAWMLLDISPGRGGSSATDLRVIISDISHLKRAEEELRASEAFQSAVLNTMAPEIAVLDASGMITMVNESWRRFASEFTSTGTGGFRGGNTGIPFRASGRLASDLMTEKGVAEACAGIQAVLDGRLPFFNLEYACASPGGRQWVILNAVPIGNGGRGAVLSHTNITKYKQQEERLRDSQKAAALGTLAGGIAHDFNNLLAIILGNTEMTRRKAARSGNPEIQELLGDIHKAASRAVDIVKQILTFSRGQSAERRPVYLTPTVLETVRLLRSSLPIHCTLEAWCDPAAPLVRADAVQIQQVLLNLVTNAMQAIKTGPGRIEVRLESVRPEPREAEAHPELMGVFAAGNGQAARITITDTGLGMDAATMARIFDPFFTTKPVDEGTGLGLSVVQGIVRNHGGAILVESEPGKGSAFRIYLPQAEGAPEPGESLPAEPVSSGIRPPDAERKGRILILDDEVFIVSFCKKQLEEKGFEITGFTDPEAAIRAVQEAPAAFDLVVTDFRMPGLSGVEVAKEIRRIREDLPVALVSGYMNAEVMTLGELAGVHDFLFKVTIVEEICDLMGRLQNQSSYIPSK